MKMNKNKLLIYVLVDSILKILVIALIVFLIVKKYPTNHMGIDIRWAYLLSIVSSLLTVCLIWLKKYFKYACLNLTTTAIYVVIIFSVDRLNILVEYENWISRGMPASPLLIERSTHQP